MTWSPDGRHLAYIEFYGNGELRTRAWLLDTTGPGTSLAAKPTLPPLGQGLPGPRPRLAARHRPAGHQRSMPDHPSARVCRRAGRQGAIATLRVDQSFGGLQFDPSGRHLLYTTGAPGIPFSDRSTWRWDGTRAVEIGTAMPCRRGDPCSETLGSSGPSAGSRGPVLGVPADLAGDLLAGLAPGRPGAAGRY